MVLKILKLHSLKGSCNFENFQNHSYLLITNCTLGSAICYTLHWKPTSGVHNNYNNYNNNNSNDNNNNDNDDDDDGDDDDDYNNNKINYKLYSNYYICGSSYISVLCHQMSSF